MVGQPACLTERGPIRDIVERLRAIGRALAIDRHDDETEFGERLVLPEGIVGAVRKGLRRADRLRAGIDRVEDGIALRRIEVRRADDAAYRSVTPSRALTLKRSGKR